MPSTMYTTKIATSSRIQVSPSWPWNALAAPCQLVPTSGGTFSAASASIFSDLHDVHYENRHQQQDPGIAELALERLGGALPVGAHLGWHVFGRQRLNLFRSARCTLRKSPPAAGSRYRRAGPGTPWRRPASWCPPRVARFRPPAPQSF